MAVPAKLPFSMGFKKIKKCLKNFNILVCPQGAKVTESRDFS